MIHTVFYSGSVGAGLSNVSIPIVPFATDTVANNMYNPPRPLKLIAVIGWGVNMSNLRVVTPYLLDQASVNARPVSITAALASNFNFADFRDSPVELRQYEPIDVQASQVDAGAQTMRAALIFWDGVMDIPRGLRRFRAGFSSATALTANVWNRVALTADQTLPPKKFGIVGIYPRSATGLVARIDCPMMYNPAWNVRPGVPVLPNVSSRLPWQLQYGYGGIMGVFDNQTQPGLEIIATAADATQAVDLDLVQLN